jgi:3-deoxy-D-manno-octulosonic-acid transferase
MGEVRVAGQFAQELVVRGHHVVASSMTESGYNLCKSVYPAGTPSFRVPLDLAAPLRRTLAHFHPSALVLVETEWWPNLLLEAASAGLKIFVVNGRISERAFRRYRLGSAYWRALLSTVEFFYMRSQEDAGRLLALGVDAGRVKASGSLKAMMPPNHLDPPPLPAALGSERDRCIWIAGCTRPGEEDIVLDAFALAKNEFPALQLWLAPRHPDRFDQVADLVAERGFPMARWSRIETGESRVPPFAVILIDQMGLLASLYAYATVAFIGGSLKPFGGHNPLEPALAGAPVIFGPHMDDQRDAAAALLAMNAATQVSDATSLADEVMTHLRHPRSAAERELCAKKVLEQFSHVRAEVAADVCVRLGHGSPEGSLSRVATTV